MYLTQGLHRSLQIHPDRIATTFRGRHRTYREIHARVSRMASGLRNLGMSDNDRVGILALNADRYIELMLSIWWGGGVINPVNIRWSVPEILYSLDDCDTRILFVDDNYLSMAEAIGASAKCPPLMIHMGEGTTPAGMLSFEQLIADNAPMQDLNRGGGDIASIMYTGGTTGRPKGVIQTHLNLWSSAISRLAGQSIGEGASVLHVAPMFHIASLGRVILQLVAGQPHVILPAFDVLAVLQTIERERVVEMVLVPTMLQALITHPDFARYDLSSLRRLSYGASPITAPLLELALERLPGVAFIHGYGMTETSLISNNGPESHSAEGIASGRIRSAGRSVMGVSVRIVDEDYNEVPRHTIGEIQVMGANVMSGYWNRPKESAHALSGGWLNTGDGGYLDEEGYLFIVDRLKDMIVSGGENIYSAEVENALASHAAVGSCAVIGVPSERWGEAVHAIIVLKPGVDASDSDIIEHCRQRIAGYKCPKSVAFVDSLPLSAAGKVLKRDLRESYCRGVS